MKNARTRTDSQPSTPPPSEEKSNRPLTTIWVDEIGASVWSRDVMVKDHPSTYYSVTLERSYRDRDGGRKYTKSFDAETLPKVMQACQQAHDWIAGLMKKPA